MDDNTPAQGASIGVPSSVVSGPLTVGLGAGLPPGALPQVAPGGPGFVPSLGTIARNSSTASQCGKSTPSEPGFVRRFWLQSYARDLLPDERVAICLRRPIPQRSVDVCYAPASQSAHYGGLQVCASVWSCPVCASKVSERRRLELSAAVSAWRGAGCSVVLATFTLQHKAGDDLAAVLRLVKRSYELMRNGRAWVKLSSAVVMAGSVRALEVSHGSNGWHPHLHVLFFLGGPPGSSGELLEPIRQRWVDCVVRAGGYASYDHGCDLRLADDEVAAYVAKYGREPSWTAAHEVTKAVLKLGRAGGRSAFQLLADFAAGDIAAGDLFAHYARVFKGERQLFWSRGLRMLFGLADEQTDEEVATEQSEMAVILATLTPAQWRVVVGNDARADLLLVASSGDASAVRSWLAGFGIVV